MIVVPYAPRTRSVTRRALEERGHRRVVNRAAAGVYPSGPVTPYPEGTASTLDGPAVHTESCAARPVLMSHRDTFASAACVGSPEDFAPTREEPEVPTALRTICQRCPARHACLQIALELAATGYWAATTTRQRRNMTSPADPGQSPQGDLAPVREDRLHRTGQESRGWYRRGCRCRGCQNANAAQRRLERARRPGRTRALTAVSA